MINVVIIEDERLSRESLVYALKQVSKEINIMSCQSSISGSIAYLSKNKFADIIFCDVQLRDGLSFNIFRNVQVHIPVIFITGYDHYIMKALSNNGIDYLLKPVNEKDIQASLNKFKMLKSHFCRISFGNEIFEHYLPQKRSRLVVKKGLGYIALPLEDVVLFFTKNKLVYAIDSDENKYISEKNLSELEMELDSSAFFRVNRQYIINLKYIKGFRIYDKVKLQVDTTLPELNEKCNIIVSQETSPVFRKWLNEA